MGLNSGFCGRVGPGQERHAICFRLRAVHAKGWASPELAEPDP